MATTSYSILGQVAPTSGNSSLYPSPAATQTVISTIAICNTTATAANATVYVCKANGTTVATPSTGNAVLYNVSISGNTTQTFTIGLTLGAYDTIYVASGTSGALTFHAFGSQIA